MKGPHGLAAGAHRPVAMGRSGMVCSSHYLASLAGMRILMAGGNAVDAAIATAAALGLVEPHMSGPGGDGYILIHWSGRVGEERTLACVNATGPAPSGAQRECYVDGEIPHKGIRSASVPALVDGWGLAHGRFGSLSLARVFAPAAELAADGFPVSARLAAALAAEAEAGSPLFSHPPSRAIFAPAGRPLRAGEVLVSPGYSAILELIAEDGPRAFYQGPFGEEVLALSSGGKGCFSAADFDQRLAFWVEPISTPYRGYTVFEAPPNSSGHVLLQELAMVDQFDIPVLGRNTAASIHLMVEAKKLAFADRERYLADPDFVRVPLGGLLAPGYAAERARRIDPGRAAESPAAGSPEPHEDTTCFCVADRWGNAVCQLQSIQSAFGSGLVAGDTGVLLNNRMTYWHLEADHPDVLAPGKRVRHTMNPVMVFDGPELVLVCGTPGADTQVQTNLQIISHILDFGLDPQEAVEAPRWRHTQDGTESEYPHRCADQLILERRFPPRIRQGLLARGHRVTLIDDWAAAGSEQVIQIDPTRRVLTGGADPRRDSLALAW